ncbi:MAG: hypothetical protein IV100_06050 [Myxococcales bacterium]|nr:hypothetical protein [Myxococcales bacterium]
MSDEKLGDAARELARSRVGAAFAGLILLVSVASAFTPRPGVVVKPDFDLDGWRPDPERLSRVWAADEEAAQTHPIDADGRKVLDAIAGLGVAEVGANGNIADPDYAAATEKALAAATSYWFDHGKEAYLALGIHYRRVFESAVLDILARAQNANTPVRPWLDARTPKRGAAVVAPAPLSPGDDAGAVARYRAAAGNFIENAVGWGLILEDGRLAGDTPDLLRVHARLRWVMLVSEITDYTFLLDREELRALWRWRLEGDRNLAMEQRVRVAGWLKQQIEPDYPVYRVLGSLHARRGQSDKAIGYFREALLDEPFDEVARKNLEYLLRYRDGAAIEP